MKRLNFYLTEVEIENIQKEAKSKDLSMSEIIRRILDKYYEEQSQYDNL